MSRSIRTASLAPGVVDPATVLDQAIVAAAVGCLADRGVNTSHAEAQILRPSLTPGGKVLACVGFSGASISGTLVVTIPEELETVIHAAGRPNPSTEDARLDAIRELANQLLGRIKNRVVPYGVVFQVAIPQAMRCLQAWLRTDPSAGHRSHRFVSAVGNMNVWLNANLGSNFRALAPEADAPPCAEEGELILFE